MRVALVSLHDENFKDLAELTWTNNKVLYAEKHGYDAIAKTQGFKLQPLGFDKIDWMLWLMHQDRHDVYFWTGCDTMITNFHIRLNEFLYNGFDVTMTTDFSGHINCDSMVIRNTPQGRAWMQMILDEMPAHGDHHSHENGIMVKTYNDWRNVVKLIPQRYMNSYHYPLYVTKGAKNNYDGMGFSGQWHPGDFLLHVPDQTLEMRMNVFKQAANFVLK